MSWNQFQKEFAGRGYDDTTKSKLYNLVKDRVINPRARDESNVGKFSTFREAIRAFNNQDYPPLENPETPRQVRIQQLEVIMNLNRQRRKLRDELILTMDAEKRGVLKDDIEKLSRGIEKLKLEIEYEPIDAKDGSWQQFEHEMSGTFNILFSSRKLSELYKKTKGDVLSGKYPDFRTAVHAVIYGIKQPYEPPPPLPSLPPRVVYDPIVLSTSTFVPKTVEQIRQEAREEVASRVQVQPPKDTYYDPESVQTRLQQAMLKFKPEDEALLEYRRQLRKLINTKMNLVIQKRVDEVGQIDEQIKILNHKIAFLS